MLDVAIATMIVILIITLVAISLAVTTTLHLLERTIVLIFPTVLGISGIRKGMLGRSGRCTCCIRLLK